MKSIVFTRESISRLHRFGIDDRWFDEFLLPGGNHGLKRSVVNDTVYIIEEDLNFDDVPLVVINLSGEGAVFSNDRPSAMVLDRIIASSAAHFEATSQIPSTWKPYAEDDVLSFYAGNKERGKGARVHCKKNPNGSGDLFVFACTPKTVAFSDLDDALPVYRRAKSGLAEAILKEGSKVDEGHTAGITLSERLPHGFVQGTDIRDWYKRKLTDEQRRFVDLPHDGPVRLKGAAGTGKTIALVVKMLRDALRVRDEGKAMRICFVAHSQSSVDLVEAISEDLISPQTFRELSQGICTIEIRTLYDLANHHLNFQLRDLTPVSLDGVEGRHFQYDLIKLTLTEAWENKVFRSRHGRIDETIKQKWQRSATQGERSFIAELMNEFSSVIDSENIRRGEESGEKYIKRSRRAAWLLNLPDEQDRRFLLDIHSRYRKHLAGMSALSIDEMIADFNSFLDHNIWDREREREGYDAIFVDELHLFTALEKQTLQKLIKRQYDDQGRPNRPSIFMAYDVKQSPRDTFLDYFAADGSVFSTKSGLQNSELVQLSKVFRYTPQIADFLKDLDSAFPAIDVPGEWDAYVGEAELPDDAIPTLRQYGTILELLEEVFKEAKKIARKIEGGGRRVAVLCVSEEVFDKYLPPVAGRFKSDVFLVDGREATSELRHIGRRFIFSMPEYVAGLQFDTVFLIHVNQSEAPTSAGIGRRRQMISNVYLGASRAENRLHIFACNELGGPSDVLDLALDRGSLIET